MGLGPKYPLLVSTITSCDKTRLAHEQGQVRAWNWVNAAILSLHTLLLANGGFSFGTRFSLVPNEKI